MPELTVTMADGRDIHIVDVVAGAVQSADPLGLEAAPEPGPTFGRSDLGGERTISAVEHYGLPGGDPAQRFRWSRATACAGGLDQFSVCVAQVVQGHGLRCAVSDAESPGSRANSPGHREPP
jgi:hypothetical protein